MLNLSTEFFPMAEPASLRKLGKTWHRLQAAGVNGFSLTFGALGAAQDKSTACLRYLRRVEKTPPPVMHLTCRNQTWASLERRLASWRALGVERVLALKGDDFQPRNDGPNSVLELIDLLIENDFAVSAAAYPEGHPDAANPKWTTSDTDWLKRKVDAGADEIVTQFSPKTDGVLRLRDALDQHGQGLHSDARPRLKVGLMPIPTWERYVTLSERCGAPLDAGDVVLFDHYGDDEHSALSLGLAYANARSLVLEGVEHFHLYGLNNDRLLLPLVKALKALNQQRQAA